MEGQSIAEFLLYGGWGWAQAGHACIAVFLARVPSGHVPVVPLMAGREQPAAKNSPQWTPPATLHRSVPPLAALKDPASAAAAADAWEAAAGEREGKRLGLDPASSLEMALAMEAGQVPKLPPTTTLLTRSRTLLVDRAITMQDGTKVVLEKQANIFVQVLQAGWFEPLQHSR